MKIICGALTSSVINSASASTTDDFIDIFLNKN